MVISHSYVSLPAGIIYVIIIHDELMVFMVVHRDLVSIGLKPGVYLQYVG